MEEITSDTEIEPIRQTAGWEKPFKKKNTKPDVEKLEEGQLMQEDEQVKQEQVIDQNKGKEKKKRKKGISFDSDEESREAIIELFIYCIFLLASTIVALSCRHVYMYYFNKTLKDLLLADDLRPGSTNAVAFPKVVTTKDWWQYLRNAVMPDLYDGSTSDASERKLLRENFMLGPPRLRQIRVRADTCEIHQVFTRYFNECYAEYDKSLEVEQPQYKSTDFYTLDELTAVPVWGMIYEYRGAGYVQALTYDKEENIKILDQLEDSVWLDRGTRVVLFELAIYNPNTNLFDSIKLIGELPPTGGMITSSYVQAVQLSSIWRRSEWYVPPAAVVFYCLTLFYLGEELKDIRNLRFHYLTSIWNMLDFLVILMSILSFVYNFWHPYYLENLLKSVEESPNTFHSLDRICYWNILYLDTMAICTFIVWIKIFKYISFSRTMLQFSNTFKRCSKELFGFGVMFAIIFLAFAQLGLLIFGAKLAQFRNFQQSFLTLMRMVLGDFDYNSMEEANRLLGPIYFLSFTVLVFFILLNMFLAIITDTYATVKAEITEGRSNLEPYIMKRLQKVNHHLKKFYMPLVKCCRKTRKSLTGAEATEKRESTPSETLPKARNSAAQTAVQAPQIEKKFFEEYDGELQREELYRLTKRVELLEDILQHIIDTLDGISSKVEAKMHGEEDAKAKKHKKDEHGV